jgi:hypothetical protein
LVEIESAEEVLDALSWFEDLESLKFALLLLEFIEFDGIFATIPAIE